MPGPPNGRVRDVPDRRTIRYYTTLGLIDRPAEMRGRTALYGRRHLLQLVAIKKLQARGQSLAEIQQALAGLTDKALGRVAEMDVQAAGIEGKRAPSRATRDFWRQEPSLPAMAGSEETGRGTDRRTEDRPAEPVRSQTFHGVPLVEGVTLLLASSRPIDGAGPRGDPHRGGTSDRDPDASRADSPARGRRDPMSRSLPLISDNELVPGGFSSPAADDEPGFGSLMTEKGHLPLEAMDVPRPDRRPAGARDRPANVRQRAR